MQVLVLQKVILAQRIKEAFDEIEGISLDGRRAPKGQVLLTRKSEKTQCFTGVSVRFLGHRREKLSKNGPASGVSAKGK